MTNFKMSLRLSAVFVLALAFCCLVIGQAAVADGSGISKKSVPIKSKAEVTSQAQKLGTASGEEFVKPAMTVSNKATLMDKPASSGRPNEPNGNRQGGELISNAMVITGTPYSDAGTTAAYTDDYNQVCPYTSTGSPDVVYSYTPSTNTTVDISLCGSGYDTKLYVYDTPTPVGGDAIACSDDSPVCGTGSAGYRSFIGALDLAAGTTYFIVVDGYGSADYGTYTLNITAPVLCDVTAPVGAVLENEACSGDLDALPVDNVNGGCNSSPAVFGPTISLGGSLFGNTWGNSVTGYRDTDWFKFTITEPMTVTLKGVSEASFVLLLVSGDFTTCTGVAVVASASTAIPCDTIETSSILSPGTYVAFVGGDYYSDNLCADGPWDYAIWVTGVPYSSSVGQDCMSPIVVNYTGSYADLGQTTCGMVDNYNTTILGSYDGGEDIIYQINNPSDRTVNITMDPLGTAWTGWMLTTDCPGMSVSNLVAGWTNSGSSPTSENLPISPGGNLLSDG